MHLSGPEQHVSMLLSCSLGVPRVMFLSEKIEKKKKKGMFLLPLVTESFATPEFCPILQSAIFNDQRNFGLRNEPRVGVEEPS